MRTSWCDPILHMRKLRPREGMQFGQEHTATEAGIWTWAYLTWVLLTISHWTCNSRLLTANEPNCLKVNYKVAKLPSEVPMTKRLEVVGEEKNISVVRNISFSLKHLELGQTRHWQIGKWIIYIWLGTGMGMGTDWVSEHPLWESCLNLEA